MRSMAVLVGRPNKTGGAVKLRGDWGGGGLRHSFAKERALLRLRRQVCPTKLPFYAGYSEIVLRCNATSEVEQPRRRKRRTKQENQNSNGFSYNPTKTLKRCWTRFAQPRLQRFSLKKWVGPHPFFEGKALGTRWRFADFLPPQPSLKPAIQSSL